MQPQGKSRAYAAIPDEAPTRAVVSGDSVLGELMLYRSEEYPATWFSLAGFRKHNTQPPPRRRRPAAALKRHWVVKEIANG